MKHHLKALFFALLVPGFLMAQAPVITTQPENQVVCENSSAFLKIVAESTETMSYEWFKNGGSIGNNANQLDFASVTSSDEGEYYCVVSNVSGDVTSNTVTVLVVSGNPVLSSVSGGGDICGAQSHSVAVTVSNGPNSFEWYVNDELIPDGYGPSQNFDALSEENSGTYHCVVTNVCGSTVSDDILLNVIDPVNIISQPEGLTVCEGDDLMFSVEVSGTNPEYQWFENSVPMVNEQNANLTIADIQLGEDHTYYCQVSNACANEQSISVSMSIHTYPNVTASPMSTSACLGESVSLFSTSSGTPEIIGQWYVDGVALTDSVANSLTLETEANDTLYVYRAFTNECGTVNSDSAIVITDMPPMVTQQPHDTLVCEDGNAAVRVKVVGAEPIVYQWQLNDVDVYGMAYSGQNSFALQIDGLNEAYIGQYQCVVSNGCGSVVSDEAEVSVNMLPEVLFQPDALDVCEGDTAVFTVTAQGEEPITYEWRKTGSTDVLGTSNQLVLLNVAPTDDGSYYCAISNMCQTIESDVVDLNVKTNPYFVLQPDDIDICHGDSAALLVDVAGEEPIELLWFRNESALSNETDSILVFDPAETLLTGDYMCVAMNMCGITESDAVNVNIGTAPSITYGPFDQELCENESLTLYSNASGENVFYQWYNNDEPIIGQTDTVLYIPLINDNMTGTFYFQAYNGCASVNSNSADVTIKPAPEFSLGPDLDFCDGESTILSTEVVAQSYSWNNGLSTASQLEVDQTGHYFMAAIGDNGCTGYDTVYVDFHPYHTPILDESGAYCGSLTLDAGEDAYSYEWSTGSDEQSIEATETGLYFVTTEGDEFGCIASDTIYVEILEVPVVDLGEDHTIARDSVLTLAVDEGQLAYYWSNGGNSYFSDYSGQTMGAGTFEAWVNVTAQNGCVASDTVLITVLPGVSVNQLDVEEQISIYPNPTRSICNLEFNLNEKLKSVSVFDMQGRMIQNVNSEKFSGKLSLNLSELNSGMYVMSVKTNTRVFNYRLIKE